MHTRHRYGSAGYARSSIANRSGLGFFYIYKDQKSSITILKTPKLQLVDHRHGRFSRALDAVLDWVPDPSALHDSLGVNHAECTAICQCIAAAHAWTDNSSCALPLSCTCTASPRAALQPCVVAGVRVGACARFVGGSQGVGLSPGGGPPCSNIDCPYCCVHL